MKISQRDVLSPDVLSLRTFSPHGHFVCWMFCPARRFVPLDVLSLRTFCPMDIMSHGSYVSGRYVAGRFVPCVTSRISRSSLSACFLHCCWVSTAAFMGSQAGLGLAWVTAPTHTFPRLVFCIPGFRSGYPPMICREH